MNRAAMAMLLLDKMDAKAHAATNDELRTDITADSTFGSGPTMLTRSSWNTR